MSRRGWMLSCAWRTFRSLSTETLLFFDSSSSFFHRLQGLAGGASCPAAIHRLPVNSQQELLYRPVISYQPRIQEGGQGSPEHGELGYATDEFRFRPERHTDRGNEDTNKDLENVRGRCWLFSPLSFRSRKSWGVQVSLDISTPPPFLHLGTSINGLSFTSRSLVPWNEVEGNGFGNQERDLRSWVHADGFVCCSEGSVAAHLWVVMSVPSSHVGMVTVEKVRKTLQKGLRRYTGSNKQMAALTGYTFHLPSLSVTGESKTANIVSSRGRVGLFFNFFFLLLPTETDSKVIEILKASFGITPYIHCLCQMSYFNSFLLILQ